MNPRILRLDALPARAWRNGGGETREIAAHPPGAAIDAALWRISAAEIGVAGPFSAFPGLDRTIVLLRGEGVRLCALDGSFDHALDTPGAPFAFAGETPLEATPLRGPVRVLNLMIRRGSAGSTGAAAVEAVRGEGAFGPGAAWLLVPVRGEWSVRSGPGAPQTLRPGEAALSVPGIASQRAPAPGETAPLAVAVTLPG